MWRQQPTTHQNPTRTNFQQPAQRRSASSNARPSHSDPYGPNPSATPGPVRPVLRPHSQDVIEERSELPDEVTGEFALLHRYRCGALLGRGGFAKVYHFVDLDTAEEFAAKVIDKTRLKDNGKLEKLLIEIRIHEKLDHPNVLKIHRHFQDSSYMYILLEKCPNQTLLELSRARISLTVQETQYMMLQLLCGVEYLHRANVIHRDLKLANVLVDADLNLKIGDFGLAAAISHTEEVKRTMCGTPNYIAPEILAAGNQSPRSGASRGGVFAPVGRAAGSPTAASHGYTYRADYWSIGVILYTLFVGCPPFETEDLKTTYDLIQRASYTIPPSVPRAAARLIQRILQVNPEHRPSLVEMRSDPFFAGCRADAPPPPTLIEYYARLHGTSPAEYEAHVLGRHSARRRYEAMVNQPQQVQPLYLASPALAADDHTRTPAPAASASPTAPHEATPQSAARRLFTPSREQQAPGGQEDQPRPPPSVMPQALQVQAGGMYLYRAESLSPLLGNSPLGPVGAALGFPAHDVGATQRQGAVSPAGSEGFYSPTGMRPQSPASPTTAAAGGDDFLTPVLESLIKAQVGSARRTGDAARRQSRRRHRARTVDHARSVRFHHRHGDGPVPPLRRGLPHAHRAHRRVLQRPIAARLRRGDGLRRVPRPPGADRRRSEHLQHLSRGGRTPRGHRSRDTHDHRCCCGGGGATGREEGHTGTVLCGLLHNEARRRRSSGGHRPPRSGRSAAHHDSASDG
jgi:serine/threonine protein kinase